MSWSRNTSTHTLFNNVLRGFKANELTSINFSYKRVICWNLLVLFTKPAYILYFFPNQSLIFLKPWIWAGNFSSLIDSSATTLDRPIIVAHNNFLRTLLILTMRFNAVYINFQSMLTLCRKSMWDIIIVFILENWCGWLFSFVMLLLYN